MLSLDQIYAVARGAGFPPATAVKMVAIAMRESSGNPAAFNGDSSTGDRSYGLWQINMYGPLAVQRMQSFGLSSEEDLFDPSTNAAAAYQLWAGNDANLSRAWYIDRPGYREKYEQWLPAAAAAAARVDLLPVDPGGSLPGATGFFPAMSTYLSQASGVPIDPKTSQLLVLGVGAIVLLNLFD